MRDSIREVNLTNETEVETTSKVEGKPGEEMFSRGKEWLT